MDQPHLPVPTAGSIIIAATSAHAALIGEAGETQHEASWHVTVGNKPLSNFGDLPLRLNLLVSDFALQGFRKYMYNASLRGAAW